MTTGNEPWRRSLDTIETVLSEITEGVEDAETARVRINSGISAVRDLRRVLESDNDNDLSRLEILGILGAGVAHDLNNLLFVIRGSAEISAMTLQDGDPIQAKLNRIQEAVDRAEGLTRMVLHTARPNAAGPVPVPLHPLVKECLKRVESKLPGTVKIQRQIEVNSPAVAVDPVKYFMIVATVLSAAAGALEHAGGGLSVSFDRIDTETRTGNGNELQTAGPVLVLAVEWEGGEERTEERSAPRDVGSTRPFRLSEIDGSPPSIDSIVENIGANVTSQSLARGRRVEIVLPIAAPEAVR